MTTSPTPPAAPEMIAELTARMNFCVEGETIQIRMEDARALLATAAEAEKLRAELTELKRASEEFQDGIYVISEGCLYSLGNVGIATALADGDVLDFDAADKFIADIMAACRNPDQAALSRPASAAGEAVAWHSGEAVHEAVEGILLAYDVDMKLTTAKGNALRDDLVALIRTGMAREPVAEVTVYKDGSQHWLALTTQWLTEGTHPLYTAPPSPASPGGADDADGGLKC